VISEDQLADAESNGHSLFGASGWARKLACPGSTLAEIGLPDEASYEAAEGTVAHAVAEDIFERGVLPENAFLELQPRVLQEGHEVKITLAMVEYVQQYVDWCNELPGMHFVEQLVDLSNYTPIPNQKGRADHIALEIGHLTLTDLKYGTGVKVFADRNPQQAGYALGVIDEWDFIFDIDRVTIRIAQPRLGHFDVWETTKSELKEYGREIKAKLALGWQPDAPRVPSEAACRFCRAKRAGCAALVALADRIADQTFDDETAKPVEYPVTVTTFDMAASLARLDIDALGAPRLRVGHLSTAQLEALLTYRKLFESSFAEMWKELHKRALAGETLSRFMLAEGRVSRSVAARRAIIRLMGQYGVPAEDLYETQFLSPAKLEEALVKIGGVKKKRAAELLAPFLNVAAGQAVLAPIGPGKRPAVDLADSSFDDETGQDNL
jgi:hypothetical protein